MLAWMKMRARIWVFSSPEERQECDVSSQVPCSSKGLMTPKYVELEKPKAVAGIKCRTNAFPFFSLSSFSQLNCGWRTCSSHWEKTQRLRMIRTKTTASGNFVEETNQAFHTLAWFTHFFPFFFCRWKMKRASRLPKGEDEPIFVSDSDLGSGASVFTISADRKIFLSKTSVSGYKAVFVTKLLPKLLQFGRNISDLLWLIAGLGTMIPNNVSVALLSSSAAGSLFKLYLCSAA